MYARRHKQLMQGVEDALDAYFRRALPNIPVNFSENSIRKNISYNSKFKLAKFGFSFQIPVTVGTYIPYVGRETVYNIPPSLEIAVHDGDVHFPDEFKQESDFPSYADLPYEMLTKIFSYLPYEDICRMGSVCQRWDIASRSIVLWRRVNIDRLHFTPDEMKTIIPFLGKNLERLRICSHSESRFFELPPLLEHLSRNCPKLKILVIENAVLIEDYYELTETLFFDMLGKAHFRERTSDSLEVESIEFKYSVDYFEEMPSSPRKNESLDSTTELEHPLLDLSVVSLRKSFFKSEASVFEWNLSIMPNIKVLDLTLSPCRLTDDVFRVFSSLTHLEELYLSGCQITDTYLWNFGEVIEKLKILDMEDTDLSPGSFRLFRECGRNLRKLYLCNTCTGVDTMNDADFPELEILCLRNLPSPIHDIEGILGSCPKLKCLNVTQTNTEEMILNLPAAMRERVKFDKNDQFIYCNHYLERHPLTDY